MFYRKNRSQINWLRQELGLGERRAYHRLLGCQEGRLLPDQLQQDPNGIRKLIDMDVKSGAIQLDQVAATVDQDLQQIAEGNQLPQPLAVAIKRVRAAAEGE